MGKAALALIVSLAAGCVLFLVGELFGAPRLATAGAWLTIPATVAFALALVAVVGGYLAATAITAVQWLWRVLRR
jgi:hypothetical protein